MDNQENLICLNENFSTTQNISRLEPVIKKQPNDKFETFLFLPENSAQKAEGGLRTQGYFKKSLPKQPLVTVITVVFNGERYLEEAILSVLNQSYPNLEYIIIDGSSNDGTLAIIDQYKDAIDYWVSEKDQGIYDAMNKGIILSTGDIIGIVNSDDVIYPNTVANVVSAFREKPKAQYTFGKVELAMENGHIYGISNSSPNKTIEDFNRDISMPFPHATMYITKQLYKSIGLYNTKYKLRSDYDFSIKLLQQKIGNVELSDPVGFFRSGGQSGKPQTWLETRQILRENCLLGKRVLIEILSSNFKTFLKRKLPFKLFKFLKNFSIKQKTKLY